jgi:hypothetical protein
VRPAQLSSRNQYSATSQLQCLRCWRAAGALVAEHWRDHSHGLLSLLLVAFEHRHHVQTPNHSFQAPIRLLTGQVRVVNCTTGPSASWLESTMYTNRIYQHVWTAQRCYCIVISHCLQRCNTSSCCKRSPTPHAQNSPHSVHVHSCRTFCNTQNKIVTQWTTSAIHAAPTRGWGTVKTQQHKWQPRNSEAEMPPSAKTAGATIVPGQLPKATTTMVSHSTRLFTKSELLAGLGSLSTSWRHLLTMSSRASRFPSRFPSSFVLRRLQCNAVETIMNKEKKSRSGRSNKKYETGCTLPQYKTHCQDPHQEATCCCSTQDIKQQRMHSRYAVLGTEHSHDILRQRPSLISSLHQ